MQSGNECIIKATITIDDVNEAKRLLGEKFNSFDSNNCDIYIDNELIPFTKEYKFTKTGTFTLIIV